MQRVKKTLTTRRATAPRKVRTSGKSRAVGKPLTPEQRYLMIQEAAYYLAEKAGFQGDSVQHWLEAEQEINARLS